ncbi:MAG: hypothetical protein AB1798_01210 [Spirochaetota bacterium]
MRIEQLPKEEYTARIRRIQSELKKAGIDVLVSYSSECESSSSRYLAGFWPFFDFASVIVPVKGEAVLVTGGPESLEFARSFSSAEKLRINPLLVVSRMDMLRAAYPVEPVQIHQQDDKRQ